MRSMITIAFMIQAVVAGWEIYSITKNPFSLGLIGLAEAIPAISVALYAGHLADISNKRNILVFAIAGMFLSSFGLFIVTSSWMRNINSDMLTVNLMYLFIFITGIARGFYSPTGTAFISQIVSREMLSKAATLNSTFWQMSAIIGPAAGGFLYAGISISGALITVLVLQLLGLFFMLHVKSKPIIQLNNKEPIAQRLKEGLRFVYQNKIMLHALTLDMFSVLFGGAVALLPIFADEILRVGPQGLGMLRAAPSVGAAITMTWLSFSKVPGKAGKTLLWAVAGFGTTIILFGLSTNFYLSLFLLFLNGAFDSVSVIIRANIVQLLTPDEMRGRVSAVNTMFIGSSNELGAFESGVAAKLLGTVTSVVFGGTVTLLIVGITSLKEKTLKAFDY
ncbi:MAG: MFS transporter [Bacteroidetes bacterium]|nr:MFS transporter [Bacteroidota bacterium]